MIAEARKKWNSFVAAFNALGFETRGMSPESACVLLDAAVEYENDNSRGCRHFQVSDKRFAVFSKNEIVNILQDYSGCLEFWDFDYDKRCAKITEKGVAYVNDHIDVFRFLL